MRSLSIVQISVVALTWIISADSMSADVVPAGPTEIHVTQTVERVEDANRYSFRVTNNGNSDIFHFFLYLKFPPWGVANTRFSDGISYFPIQESAAVLDARNLDPEITWMVNLFLGPPFPPASGLAPGESAVVEIMSGTFDTDPKLYGYETLASGAAVEGVGPDGSQGRIAATGLAASPEPLFFAQFGDGAGFSSDTVLTNPDATSSVSGRIDFLDDDGLPLLVGIAEVVADLPQSASPALIPSGPTGSVEFSIAPRGTLTLSTDGLGETARAGAAVVTADGALGGVVRFNLPNVGIAGVGASRAHSGLIIPVRRMAAGINSGVALHNPESHPIDIELELLDSEGNSVASRTIEEFPAHGHLARFIDQLFDSIDTDHFVGSVSVAVAGRGRVAATALELGTVPGEFTTLPVTPLP